jgi:hypothetical protein
MLRCVSLPSHEVLGLLPSPVCPFVANCFHLPFGGIFNKFRRWFREVRSVLGGFSIRGKKRGVKYVVDLPYFREV